MKEGLHLERLCRALRQLVDTFELTLEVRDEEVLLRVEIFLCADPAGHYVARIWRCEYFRIQSTFPQMDGVPAHSPSDELIIKEFEGIEPFLSKPQPFDSAMDARAFVMDKIASWVEAQVHAAGGQDRD